MTTNQHHSITAETKFKLKLLPICKTSNYIPKVWNPSVESAIPPTSRRKQLYFSWRDEHKDTGHTRPIRIPGSGVGRGAASLPHSGSDSCTPRNPNNQTQVFRTEALPELQEEGGRLHLMPLTSKSGCRRLPVGSREGKSFCLFA